MGKVEDSCRWTSPRTFRANVDTHATFAEQKATLLRSKRRHCCTAVLISEKILALERIWNFPAECSQMKVNFPITIGRCHYALSDLYTLGEKSSRGDFATRHRETFSSAILFIPGCEQFWSSQSIERCALLPQLDSCFDVSMGRIDFGAWFWRPWR